MLVIVITNLNFGQIVDCNHKPDLSVGSLQILRWSFEFCCQILERRIC